MRRVLFCPCFAILFALAVLGQQTVSPNGGERRVALIVGNDQYPNAPLKNAVNDATAISGQLKAAGFSTSLVTNVDLQHLDYAIERFLRGLQAGDIALLYYSGHGMQIRGENYLIPTSFDAKNEIDAKYEAYPLSRAVEGMAGRSTRLNLVILDACRDNPFIFSRSMPRGWAPMTTASGTYIAFATSPGSTASDGMDKNGLFTSHLLNALRQPGLDVDAVFKLVRAGVYHDSNGAQLPWTASSMVGDFAFNLTPVASTLSGGSVAPSGNGLNVAEQTGLTSVRSATLDMVRLQAGASVATPVNMPGLPVAPPGTSGSRVLSTEAFQRRFDTPADAPGYAVRARAFAHDGQYELAIGDLDEALRLDPSYSGAYRDRGRVYAMVRQFDRAVADLSRAIALNPSDAESLYLRTLTYSALGDYELAEHDATSLIRAHPESVAGYLARSTAYLGIGRYREAVEDCSHVLSTNPDMSVAYAIRGSALRALGQPEAAAKDFDTASKLILSVQIR